MHTQPPEHGPSEHRYKEYEDPHFHDEIEVIVPDEDSSPAKKPLPKKKFSPQRRYPKPRYPDED